MFLAKSFKNSSEMYVKVSGNLLVIFWIFWKKTLKGYGGKETVPMKFYLLRPAKSSQLCSCNWNEWAIQLQSRWTFHSGSFDWGHCFLSGGGEGLVAEKAQITCRIEVSKRLNRSTKKSFLEKNIMKNWEKNNVSVGEKRRQRHIY